VIHASQSGAPGATLARPSRKSTTAAVLLLIDRTAGPKGRPKVPFIESAASAAVLSRASSWGQRVSAQGADDRAKLAAQFASDSRRLSPTPTASSRRSGPRSRRRPYGPSHDVPFFNRLVRPEGTYAVALTAPATTALLRRSGDGACSCGSSALPCHRLWGPRVIGPLPTHDRHNAPIRPRQRPALTRRYSSRWPPIMRVATAPS
jgi:hypothetical protein